MSEENKNITEVLKEATKDFLSEESLTQIQEAFEAAVDEKVSIHVEKAISEIDEDHAQKLEKLLEAVDNDHSNKLERVVESINQNHAQKLAKVVKKFSTDVKQEARMLKESLVATTSKYLDAYLDKAIPMESIEEAARNKQAAILLEDLRNKLAVGSALMNESIKDAVKDGQKQLQEATKKAQEATSKVSLLKEQLEKKTAELLLEKKTLGLSPMKKKHIMKVLSDKSSQYIEENFDYTLKLFDKSEEERLEVLSEKATKAKKTVDRPVSKKPIINEKKNQITEKNYVSQYLDAFED